MREKGGEKWKVFYPNSSYDFANAARKLREEYKSSRSKATIVARSAGPRSNWRPLIVNYQ